MGDKLTLKLESRELHGKKVTRLRQQGLTPAIVYGPGMDPLSVQADSAAVKKIVNAAGKHTPVYLTGVKRHIAMIKDVDINPAKNTIRHVAFHAVNADEPVVAEVPIFLKGEGESPAERAGLIVLQAIDKAEVRALPTELPEKLEADISSLVEPGDRVTIGDIVMPQGVELVEKVNAETNDDDEEQMTMADLVVASVYEPSALQAANDAAGGDAEDAGADNVKSENGDDTSQPATDASQQSGNKDKKE